MYTQSTLCNFFYAQALIAKKEGRLLDAEKFYQQARALKY